MRPILFTFIIANLLTTIPALYLFPQYAYLSKVSLVSILLFSIVWFILLQIVYIGKARNVDGIALALGGVIGVKFFGSLTVFLTMYFMKLLSGKPEIIMFLTVYAMYAVLIAYFGTKQVLNDTN